MTAQPIEYQSSRPHHKSWAILWTPDDDVEVKGVVQICHGMCEYTERYGELAVWLCKQGYAVCGNDHVGHKNTALLTSQRLGYFGGINRWQNLVEDVELLRKKLAPRFVGVPWILLGHSMGSFVARLCAERYGSDLSALVLSGTGGKNPSASAGKVLARSIVAYKGPMHVSRLLCNMSDSTFEKALEEGNTEGNWVTSDNKIAAAYKADPYCQFKFTASAFHDLFEMMDSCNSSKWFASIPKELPIYIFSGTRDPVGDFGKGVRQVSSRLRSAGVKNVTLKLYEGGRHEMLNEVNRQDVYADLLAWITANT